MKERMSIVHNCDCLEYMRTVEDKYFDLTICDCPYGIKASSKDNSTRGKLAVAKSYTIKDWDDNAPDKEVFDEILRVSKHCIIWGANHFISKIPYDSSCWIVWDKQNGTCDFADCELAWTNFSSAVRKFEFRWAGMLQGNMKHKEVRIHPTQKPVALYAWLLKNYAKDGDKIFDPYLGSQSSRIAAYELNYDFVGCELDKEYFEEGNKRFAEHTSQLKLF